MERTRRRFLASGAALLGLTASSAGCLSTLPPLGQEIRYGRVDLPESASPTFRRWIPVKSALQPYSEHDVDSHAMYGIPGETGEELLGESVGLTSSFHIGQTDYVGFDYESYDHALTTSGVFVGEKDVDRTVVEATLAKTGYERTDTYHGYDLYTRSDIPRALAVGDEAVLYASDDSVENARGRVTTTIDAGDGRVERRHEAEPDFEALTELTGARPFTWLGASGLEIGDSTTGATSATFDSDAVYFVWDQVYPSADATPSESEVKDYLEEENRPQRSLSTDIEIDGRLLSVEMRMDAEEFRAEADSHVPPHITWGVDYDAEERTLTFHHEVGESVPSERLLVVPEYGYEGEAPFERFEGEFGPGDSVTLDLLPDADEDYRIEWHAPDDSASSSLVHYDIEEQS